MNIVQKLILISPLLISTSSYAQPPDIDAVPTVSKITKEVLRAANSYASAVSCGESPAEAKDILALHPYKKKEDAFDSEYLVFWHGDIGCAGGSGTHTDNVALVRVGSFDSFYVDPSRSSPTIELEFNTRFLERLVGNTGDTIIVDASEFAARKSTGSEARGQALHLTRASCYLNMLVGLISYWM
ncbi:MAG: hypothetical protein NTV43_17680 [Methylococcales bacterium]|nr:hypothetical protein [Methylococcales bacterium]